MKLFTIVLLAFVFACHASFPQSGIIPKPVSQTLTNGTLALSGPVKIVASSDEEKQEALLLKEQLTALHITADVVGNGQGKNTITLKIAPDKELGEEGYALTANSSGVAVTANAAAGLFYGTQSLLQLLDDGKIPYTTVRDYPRFPYRGLHLDVGRHFFPATFIKKYIDLMAKHKFNRFHWHLTEDQGWRIEIKKYPRLQEVSAFRKETVIGKSTTKTRAQARYDGQPYGGFYTQDEVRDIVKYAADRHVTVIPEIELPGHSQAVLAAYPNLGCTGGPYTTATSWGVFEEVYCAGKEETFTFLQDVFDEVLALFPGKYIHIGGDECPKTRWKACPHCQERIRAENLKDEHGLQSYFIRRMEKYLNGKGRQIIGWDEILEGGLAPNATVMSWRGEEGGIAAAKQNHDVIMTPGEWCYLDKYQDKPDNEPLAIGGYLPVSKVYSYNPLPAALSPDEARHILGAQCNVWSEYVKTPEQVEYMVYPRACAMAEVLWTPKNGQHYEDFVQRMKTHVRRLRAWNVNYAHQVEKEF